MVEYIEKEIPNITKIVKTNLIKELCNDDGKLKISYNPRLHLISENLSKIFEKDEIEIMAKAIQDHNVDYKNVGVRYESESIYGKIISDADKDDVPEVFALRTIMYAANKNGLQKHIPFFIVKNPTIEQQKEWNSNIVPDLRQCAKHVLHQSWERCRESINEFQIRTKLLATQRRIWDEIGKYKENFKGTKGIAKSSGPIELPKDIKDLERLTKDTNYAIVDNNLYLLTLEAGEGEDLYSELDTKSGTNKINESRSKYISIVREWADIDNEEKSLNFIEKLAIEWSRSKSNEEIINKYEAKNCKEFTEGKMKNYCFKNIVKICIMNGSSEGYKTLDEQERMARQEISEFNKNLKPVINKDKNIAK